MNKWQIEAKPNDVYWTDPQWQAISLKGGNILVAAAAGSGKTAVLVERIVRRIIDPLDEVEVDRLLIVTFTKAAAAEMKARIGERIEAELSLNPTAHLKRQRQLLNRANISTLHAFCSELIRKHYYEVNVDPTVRIANDTERELLKEEVLDAVLEAHYEKPLEEAAPFYTMVNAYSNDRSDQGVRKLILELYLRSRAHPEPANWLKEVVWMYEREYERLEETKWGQEFFKHAKEQIQAVQLMHEKALRLAGAADGPAHYGGILQFEQENLVRLEALTTWDQLYEALKSFKWDRLPGKKKEMEFDQELADKAKSYRDEAKKELGKVANQLGMDEAGHLAAIKQMRERIGMLVQVVQTFAEEYKKTKQVKALMDYDDLEHLALAILSRETITEPSAIANTYQTHFQEVLTDEYQDTNQVQEAILNLLSNGHNRFMVGDVKQSIYRFRLAEPGLFIEKQESYDTLSTPLEQLDESLGIRIDLADNFRSRNEVLDAVNYVFEQTMDKQVGEVTYDQTQSLRYGNVDYETDTSGYEVEIALLEREAGEEEDDEASGVSAAEKEALWTANKINAFIDSNYPVFDKETKQLRPVEYRDITVLMRSLPSAPTYLDVFKQAGIPAYSDRDEGYFRHVEVQIMLSLLHIIDNPYQDIPLAAVLRSPIVGLSEQELAEIRLMRKQGHFYEAVKDVVSEHVVQEGKEQETYLQQRLANASWQGKVALFDQHLQKWRVRARSTPLASFIWELFLETGYDAYVGGLSAGKQRQANVRALYDRAKTFEKTSFRGIFRFLRFIERMEEQGDDFDSARTLSEQENVVRIMSIHKSKGLEFPVVFVVDMWKSFNLMDVKRSTQIHQSLGFGSIYVDTHRRLKTSTLPEIAIKQVQEREQISEELRVLYVALTRAKEKAILVGSVKNREKVVSNWLEQAEHPEQYLSLQGRKKARRFFDWVMPTVLRHPDILKQHESLELSKTYPHQAKWALTFVDEIPPLAANNHVEVDDRMEIIQRLQAFPISQAEKELLVEERLSFSYAYPNATRSFAKQSVTELKRDEAESDPYEAKMERQTSSQSNVAARPAFLKDESLTGADKGTIMHTVMQQLPLQAMDNQVLKQELETIISKNQLTASQVEAIDVEAINQFLQSPLGNRLEHAQEVLREVPFSFMRPLRAFQMTTDHEANDSILIRGMADVLFWDESNQLILVDYKTDQIESRFPGGMTEAEPILRARYESQLTLYKEALESIWGQSVVECWLYFFDGGHSLKV
ncbi:ATP-dependent nuclease, subunit A [Bacillus sp. JCM 19046]|nr:ATP-dependent nuclease, subunit A [Bacillus sp. JCM 19045]GAF15828.1 ATP-dependent nuclease, subunit A [Bacillus sp. JCM 19046]